MTKPKYTVFDCGEEIPCNDCDHLNCVSLPNNPRKSNNGKQAIATGIFKKAPGAVFLTQPEAEKLMNSDDWSKEAQENHLTDV